MKCLTRRVILPEGTDSLANRVTQSKDLALLSLRKVVETHSHTCRSIMRRMPHQVGAELEQNTGSFDSGI
jgi:hypothetical protein